jgi:hypothetical protein
MGFQVVSVHSIDEFEAIVAVYFLPMPVASKISTTLQPAAGAAAFLATKKR